MQTFSDLLFIKFYHLKILLLSSFSLFGLSCFALIPRVDFCTDFSTKVVFPFLKRSLNTYKRKGKAL